MPDPILNITRLRELLGNDDAMVVQFIEIFKEEVPAQLEGIREAIHRKDWDAISTLTHAIKSQVRYLELNELATLAQTIEKCAERRVQTESIPSLFNELESSLAAVIQRL